MNALSVHAIGGITLARSRSRAFVVLCAVSTLATFLLASPASASGPTLHKMPTLRGVHGAGRGGKPRGTPNLSYHGGVGGVGVQTAPALYLVTWGWTSDPSGEEAYLRSFLGGVGGSAWNNSVTQYCQNVPTGTVFCSSASGAVYAGNPAGTLVGVWDDPSAPPSHPSQSQLAQEAVNAAAHFGNTASGANANAQYVIATAHGKSSSGFGVQYCAWHSSTTSAYGTLAYTNLPYIPDAGGACGQSFVNSGSAGLLDGVSIVAGHEMAETETDPFPNGGWLDGNGGENADKCAWISSGQGAAADVTLSTGTFAVQALWSNAFNGGAGGCVTAF